MAHSTTKEEWEIITVFIEELRDKSTNWKEAIDTSSMWFRYRDDEVEGVWKDPETGFIASFMNCKDDPNDCYGVINWELNTQPEGGRAEQCVCGFTYHRLAWDITCKQKMNVICEEISTEITIRGLCPLSKIDKKYLMAPDPVENRRFFTGYGGWKLIYENNIWSLQHVTISDTYAEYTASKDYPMGRKTWSITNDVCSGNVLQSFPDKDDFSTLLP